VTGAGGGLGRDYVLALASRGARVLVNDISSSVHGEGADEGPAEQVAREIRDAGGEALADTHSVSSPEAGKAIIDTALDAWGRVDILINNAGVLRDKAFHNVGV